MYYNFQLSFENTKNLKKISMMDEIDPFLFSKPQIYKNAS